MSNEKPEVLLFNKLVFICACDFLYKDDVFVSPKHLYMIYNAPIFSYIMEAVSCTI